MSHFRTNTHYMMRPNPFSSGAYGYSASEGYPAIREGATDEASGGAVTALKQRLSNSTWARDSATTEEERLAASILSSDRDFSAALTKAVKSFQRYSDLTADGIVGPSTWKALGYEGKVTTGASLRPRPSVAPVSGATAPPPSEESIMDKVWFWPAAILVPTAAVIGGILLWPSKKKTASVSMGAIPMASNPRRRRSKRSKR